MKKIILFILLILPVTSQAQHNKVSNMHRALEYNVIAITAMDMYFESPYVRNEYIPVFLATRLVGTTLFLHISRKIHAISKPIGYCYMAVGTIIFSMAAYNSYQTGITLRLGK